MKQLREQREKEQKAREENKQGQGGTSKEIPDDQWYWNSGSDNYKNWVPFAKEESNLIETNFNNMTKEIVL